MSTTPRTDAKTISAQLAVDLNISPVVPAHVAKGLETELSALKAAQQGMVSIADIEAEIAHIQQNGVNLAKFGGDNVDEGRCRELCAMYLREFIIAKRMKDMLAASQRREG